MKVDIAFPKNLDKCCQLSFQKPFPKTNTCPKCKGVARLAFVAHENKTGPSRKKVCQVNSNGGRGDYWLHDLCAVAVYLCRDCFGFSAIGNQG